VALLEIMPNDGGMSIIYMVVAVVRLFNTDDINFDFLSPIFIYIDTWADLKQIFLQNIILLSKQIVQKINGKYMLHI
jgi:hypothetical protein